MKAGATPASRSRPPGGAGGGSSPGMGRLAVRPGTTCMQPRGNGKGGIRVCER